MILQNTIYNVGDIITWEFTAEVINDDPNALSKVEFSIPVEFTIDSAYLSSGTYTQLPTLSESNPVDPTHYHYNRNRYEWDLNTTGIHTIRLNLEFIGPAHTSNLVYRFIATKMFGDDTITTNNSLIDTINYVYNLGTIQGSTVPAYGHGGFIDLDEYSTYPSDATARWEYNSVVDGEFELQMGSKFWFTYDYPDKEITGTWDLYLSRGGNPELLVSNNETFTIPRLFNSLTWTNHKRYSEQARDLSPEEFNELQAIYPELTLDTCLDYFRNFNGEITTWAVVACEDRNNLAAAECINESYTSLEECSSCDDPKDKVTFSFNENPQEGDLYIANFLVDNLTVYYIYTDGEWIESCKTECCDKFVQNLMVPDTCRLVYHFSQSGQNIYKYTDGELYAGDEDILVPYDPECGQNAGVE